MTADAVAPVVAGLGVGIALAGAPGPVQAVLMAEAVRGGVGRGFRALAGANLTFGFLLLCLALGVSVATPSGPALRALKVAGGALLLWLAAEGFRSSYEVDRPVGERRTLHPTARGALSVLLNPGAWLFLGAVASPLFATATHEGGKVGAVFVAVALTAGAGLGDSGVVLLGGLGVRRAGGWVRRWVPRGLAVVLAGLGVWLLVQGIVS